MSLIYRHVSGDRSKSDQSLSIPLVTHVINNIVNSDPLFFFSLETCALRISWWKLAHLPQFSNVTSSQLLLSELNKKKAQMFSFGGWGKKPYSKFSGWLQPQSPRRPLELCRYKSNLGMALTADGLSFTTEQTDAFGGETEMLCIFTSKKKKKKKCVSQSFTYYLLFWVRFCFVEIQIQHRERAAAC